MTPNASTKILRLIGALALGTGAVAGAGGCARSNEASAKTPDASEAPPLAVSLVPVKDLRTPRFVTLSGTLTGAQEAEVAAGASGKVVSTFIERGSVVHKGAVLVRLDARAVSAQAAQAEADLEGLRLQAAQAELDCERTEKMFQKGAISKSDYDKQHTQCESSKWSVSSAEARRTLTAEALHDTEIKAPFSGMIVERAVTAGEYVRPETRVATLVDTDALRVEITVPEADVVSVKQGMMVDFRTTAGEDGRLYHGKIRYVGPSVRRQSRDAVVEAVFDNSTHELRPGMFVTARIALGEQTMPAVPATALRTEGSLRHVFVNVEGRLEERLVQAGDPLGNQVPIVSGVKTGEVVVADLTPDVRDGARVK